jgi:Acetyltransferase (GNAT) domain
VARVQSNVSRVNINLINPLLDRRWDDLVKRHPKSSVFHQRGWLDALVRTYGYEPLVLTNASEGEPIEEGIILCRVSSWITGTRLVSLPFADHCEPLLNDPSALPEFASWLRAECDRRQWRYVEMRPLSDLSEVNCGLQAASSYFFHELDLTGDLEQIWHGFHKDSIQRKIQRAEKESLTYEAGCSQRLEKEFYRLMLKTRRRHRLVPQPRAWFRNLLECMQDRVEICLAQKNGTPVAAMLTLRHGSTIVYKYGCSDERFHNLGGMPFLFWRLIATSKARGVERLDLGRSDLDNQGLIAFKDRFGASRKQLTYRRYWSAPKNRASSNWDSPALRRLFSILPDAALATAGRLLYRHIG